MKMAALFNESDLSQPLSTGHAAPEPPEQMSSCAPGTAIKSADEGYVFQCRTHLLRELLSVIRGIAIKKEALCCISPQGIQFTVEQAKSLGAYAYLQKSLFTQFDFKLGLVHQLNFDGENEQEDTVLRFVVDLGLLLECFAIVLPRSGLVDSDVTKDCESSKQASITISLESDLSRLLVSRKDGSIDTECSILTYEVEGYCDLAGLYRSTPTVNRVIMQSKALRDSLNEFEKSVPTLTLELSANDPNLRLAANSVSGQVELDFSSSSSVLESFQCGSYQKVSFSFAAMMAMMRALIASTKVNMRTNDEGILSVQCMVPITSSENCFAEFVILPLVEEEDLLN